MRAEDLRYRWFENILSTSALPMKSCVTITSEYDKHLGPTWQSAGLTVVVSQSEGFSFTNKVPMTDDLAGAKFPEYAVFGFLDIIMVADQICSECIKLEFTEARFDTVNTTAMAFREAGRDAGRKLLHVLKIGGPHIQCD